MKIEEQGAPALEKKKVQGGVCLTPSLLRFYNRGGGHGTIVIDDRLTSGVVDN